MKQRKRWLGLAVAPFALALLAFAQPAKAADYTGDCANIPDHVTGDAVVNDSACVIDTGATLIVDGTLTIDAVSVDVKSEVQAVSKVTIRTTTGELKLRKKASSQFSDILLQAPQNRIETKVLEAGNSVQVDAGLNGAEGSMRDIVIDGRIVVNKHQPFSSPDIHANVLLRASGPISTKTIRTDGALGDMNIKSGGIQIEAYRTIALAEGAGEFVIGGPGVNGVDGELITRSTVGGGTNSVTTIGGVNIVNGNRLSQGSIRLVDVSAIKINATQSRSGFLELNAQAGKIFLPEGRLDSDSAPGQRAGIVLLLAKTLDVQAGTIISASQAQDDPGSSHQVVIAAETVKYRGGEAGGLKVLADGHGVPGYFGLVQLVPYGYLTPVNTTDQHNNVNQMFWTYTVNTPELAKDGALTLDGTEGNAPLLLRADGNTAAVNVSGYPLTFNGGDVTIRSRGQTLHRINVGFFGTVTGAREGLTINNVGNWVLDANGQASASGGAAAGGIIQVKADQSSLIALDSATDPSSGNIVIRANGDDANGDGGIISVDTKSFVLGDTTRAVVSANGAPNGTGNAVTAPLESAGPFAVTFKSGSTNMIFGGGNKAVKITATGGKTSGNGGTIKVLPSTGTITVRNSLALDASAIGNNCGTSCDAGQIQVVASGEIKANTSTTAPVVPAIKANGAGSGTGGKIILQSTGDVVTEGSIEANGGCDGGDGGEITLTGENVKTLGESSASGGDGSFCLAVAGSPNSFAARLAPGSANGGKKTINANDKWLNGPLTALHFDGKGDGKGGEIIINNPNKQVDLSPLPKDGITARAGKDGKGIGGKVTIASAKGAQNSLIDVNRIIKVDGGSGVDAANDSFGKISLNGVSCEQWKTGFQNAFPATYWNCIDGARATGMPVAIAANSLPNGLRSLLGETKDQQNHPSVQIYVMASIDSWADFFKTADAGAGGVYGISSSSIRVSAAFANVYSSGALISSTAAFPPASSGSATVMQATMLHELGHQLDYIWGDITSNAQSPYNAAYLQARTDDLTRLLNSGACSNAFTVATCNANAASWAGLTNLQIYGSGNPAANPPIKGLGYSTSNLELLPIVFGHLMGAGQYGVAPDLENVVQTQFTDLSAFVQGLINNPPPAVQ